MKQGKHIPPQAVADIKELNSKFFKIVQIARALNVHRNTVSNVLKKSPKFSTNDYLTANRDFLKKLYVRRHSTHKIWSELNQLNKNCQYNISPSVQPSAVAAFCQKNWVNERQNVSDEQIESLINSQNISRKQAINVLSVQIGGARFQRLKSLVLWNQALLTSVEFLREFKEFVRLTIDEDGVCQLRCICTGQNIVDPLPVIIKLKQEVAKLFFELVVQDPKKNVIEHLWGTGTSSRSEMENFFRVWELDNVEDFGDKFYWGNQLTLALISMMLARDIVVFSKYSRHLTYLTPEFQSSPPIHELLDGSSFNVEKQKTCIILELDDEKEHYNLICSQDEIYRDTDQDSGGSGMAPRRNPRRSTRHTVKRLKPKVAYYPV